MDKWKKRFEKLIKKWEQRASLSSFKLESNIIEFCINDIKEVYKVLKLSEKNNSYYHDVEYLYEEDVWLPCPFCGNKDVSEHHGHTVSCGKCTGEASNSIWNKRHNVSGLENFIKK